MESALGPALQAAYTVMQDYGGKMLVFQNAVPSLGALLTKAQRCLLVPHALQTAASKNAQDTQSSHCCLFKITPRGISHLSLKHRCSSRACAVHLHVCQVGLRAARCMS